MRIDSARKRKRFIMHCIKSILAHMIGLARLAQGKRVRCPHRLEGDR